MVAMETISTGMRDQPAFPVGERSTSDRYNQSPNHQTFQIYDAAGGRNASKHLFVLVCCLLLADNGVAFSKCFAMRPS